MRSNDEKIKEVAFHEVKANPPARVKRTQRKRGKRAAQKQATAIALSKARQMGAKVKRNA